jgi:hypothetical protein
MLRPDRERSEMEFSERNQEVNAVVLISLRDAVDDSREVAAISAQAECLGDA